MLFKGCVKIFVSLLLYVSFQTKSKKERIINLEELGVLDEGRFKVLRPHLQGICQSRELSKRLRKDYASVKSCNQIADFTSVSNRLHERMYRKKWIDFWKDKRFRCKHACKIARFSSRCFVIREKQSVVKATTWI